jgi:hypothetical protein
MFDRVEEGFGIKIDFDRSTGSPNRVFLAMSEMVEALHSIDSKIIGSLDLEIKSVFILEDIQSGSIISWFRQQVKNVDDKDLENLDYKKILGKFLVGVKKVIAEQGSKNDTINNVKQLQEIHQSISDEVDKAGIRAFPGYSHLTNSELLVILKQLHEALQKLDPNDRAEFLTSNSKTRLNLNFNITDEQIEKLIVKETLESHAQMLLKIKKADFLGESQWEFKHERKKILGKIEDERWLIDYQTGKHDVRPGSSLRCIVDIIVKYDFDNEVISTQYIIRDVIEIIPPTDWKQMPLLPETRRDQDSHNGDDKN